MTVGGRENACMVTQTAQQQCQVAKQGFAPTTVNTSTLISVYHHMESLVNVSLNYHELNGFKISVNCLVSPNKLNGQGTRF